MKNEAATRTHILPTKLLRVCANFQVTANYTSQSDALRFNQRLQLTKLFLRRSSLFRNVLEFVSVSLSLTRNWNGWRQKAQRVHRCKSWHMYIIIHLYAWQGNKEEEERVDPSWVEPSRNARRIAAFLQGEGATRGPWRVAGPVGPQCVREHVGPMACGRPGSWEVKYAPPLQK